MISQFGIQPFGSTGPFSLPGKITVLAVVASAQNRLIVFWDVPPNVRDPKGTRSATNVGNYTITAIDPTIDTINGPVVPLGEFVPSFEVGLWRAEVDEVDATQIHIWTDRNMEPARRYNVVIDGPIDGADNCEEFAGPLDWPIQAPWPPPVVSDNPARVAELVDLDDGLVPGGDIPEVWHYTSSGDIALQGTVDALKKRIIRMLSSREGTWVYDPSFGVYMPLKVQARQEQIQRSVNSIRATLQSDPLVDRVVVTAQVKIQGGDAYVIYGIAVFRRDRRRVDLSIPVPIRF